MLRLPNLLMSHPAVGMARTEPIAAIINDLPKTAGEKWKCGWKATIIQVQDVLRGRFESFETISIDRQLRLYGPVVAGINQVFKCREARKGLGHMATEFERHV